MRSNLSRLDPLFARMWGQTGDADADDTMERTSHPSIISGAL